MWNPWSKQLNYKQNGYISKGKCCLETGSPPKVGGKGHIKNNIDWYTVNRIVTLLFLFDKAKLPGFV